MIIIWMYNYCSSAYLRGRYFIKVENLTIGHHWAISLAVPELTVSTNRPIISKTRWMSWFMESQWSRHLETNFNWKFRMLTTENWSVAHSYTLHSCYGFIKQSPEFSIVVVDESNVLLFIVRYESPLLWTAADKLKNHLKQYTRCLRKNCAKFFLSELRQFSINFNNFC